ncbi:MAG: cyclase family protein [Rhizobacter sp.]|nr:cyclase family protein [Bacteriovorax sp.]
MPYILSPIITSDSSGMWGEGTSYEKKSIYSITPGKLPPVNYDAHTIKPHSLTHIETPAHTQAEGKRIDFYFKNRPEYFWGKTLVIRLTGNHYQEVGNGIFHWVITVDQIQSRLKELKMSEIPSKVLITAESSPSNSHGYHDPNFVLTLSQEAADFLISHHHFHLYGTSWKSSDYKPGSSERPIHNTLFSKGIILENLKLDGVPEGIYFMSAYPLPLMDASESPVVPILFTREELNDFS